MCVFSLHSINIILHNNKDYTWEYKTLYDTKQFFNQLGFILLHLEQTSNINLNSLKTKVISFMPTHLYLTTHINANRVRQLRSNFLAYQTSLGLSGGSKHNDQILLGFRLGKQMSQRRDCIKQRLLIPQLSRFSDWD